MAECVFRDSSPSSKSLLSSPGIAIFMEARSPGAEFRDNQPPLPSAFRLHDLPGQESGISRMFSFGATKYLQCGRVT